MDESLVPAYRRLAADLRRAITDGTYPPGATLPSEAELVMEYGVSRTTVRNGLRILRGAGLIDVPGPGQRTTVRLPSPRIRRDGSRYQYEKDQALETGLPYDSHLAREVGLPADQTHVELIDDQVIEADQDMTAALRLEPAEPVHRYTFLISAGDVPGRVAHHYVAEALDQRVRQSLPSNAIRPGSAVWPGGAMYQLARQGIEIAHVHDVITTRMPLPEEVTALRLREGVPVLCVRKTSYDTADVPREVADVVMPADRTDCSYTVLLETWTNPPDWHDDSDVD